MMCTATIRPSIVCRQSSPNASDFESALFFPTGTQSNLAALMAHCGRGDEFLVGQEAHTYKYEQGGAAVLGSIQPQPLEHEPHGGIALERIAAAIKSDDYHFARTRLLALENTIGGRVLPLDYQRDGHGVRAFARTRHASRWCAHFQCHRQTASR